MPLRHDRRRRVLADESGKAPALEGDAPSRATSDERPARGPLDAYTSAARREQQPHLTDLVPRRYRGLSLWLALGFLAIGAIEGLYAAMPRLAGWLGMEQVPALDLALRGSLATWLSSLLLGTSSLAAVLLYSLRRHRVDDYHGRYRVWLWAALAAILLSLDQVTAVHQLARGLVARAAAQSGMTPGWVWAATCATLAVLGGLRLLIEIRHCRLAVASLATAAISFLVAVAVYAGWIGGLPGPTDAMLLVGTRMGGELLLLFALLAYARHVILDAEGLLPERAARKPKVKKVKASRRSVEKADGTKVAIDPPQKPKPHVAPRTDLEPMEPSKKEAAKSQPPAKATVEEDEEEDEESGENRALTRAERKKLRREMKRA